MSTQTIPEATATPTEYAVSCLPIDHPARRHFTITVAYRGRDLWAVTNGADCLSAAGEWDWEPSSSNRDDDWLETHRFPLERALELAKAAAPHLTVNRFDVAYALGHEKGW